MHLFTYGTLMFAEVWRQVVGSTFPAQRATLAGYAVYRVRDKMFPGMVRAEPNKRVAGVVYCNLDEEVVGRLDAYEADFYDRVSVEVTVDDCQLLECQAYVVPESKQGSLSNELWDADWFEQHHLADYLRG